MAIILNKKNLSKKAVSIESTLEGKSFVVAIFKGL